MDSNEQSHPASWRETLIALVPFLLYPLIYPLGMLITPFISDSIDPIIGLYITLGIIGVLLIVMLAGWVREFPRWVFPYWGFILTITLYMRNFTGTMSGRQVRGDWWVWMPVVVIAMAGTLWARGFVPVVALLKSIWKDWTTLSFTFYGALPLLFIAAYDEVHDEEPYLALIMLILAVGVVIYMRTENIWHRFASLVGGFTLGWSTLMIHQGIYWNGRQEFWMQEPGSWVETLNWTSRFGAMLMLVLVAPVLVEFLRRAVSAGRMPKAAG
jgi:hypothetical protein